MKVDRPSAASISRFKRVRRGIGLILLESSGGGSRRRVRFFMGRPDGLLAGYGDRFWLYWCDRKGAASKCCISIGFSDTDEMAGWDMLFAIDESQFVPFKK
jgi:hypothetical protein